MKKIIIIASIMVLTLMLFASNIAAENKPVQLSLFNPIQLFPEDTPVSGIRLNLIYGKNSSVTGLDWGLVNHTTTGLTMGVQFGVVGLADADFKGWQSNAVNITKNNFEGLQWGLFNSAKYVNGVQIGLVNYAGSMKGLQIGLVNIINQGGQFPVFPIVNWSF